MKQFLRLIGALSFWELIGRYPVTAGVLTILGVGGGVVASGVLTPPSITPQPSTAFGQSQGVGSSVEQRPATEWGNGWPILFAEHAVELGLRVCRGKRRSKSRKWGQLSICARQRQQRPRPVAQRARPWRARRSSRRPEFPAASMATAWWLGISGVQFGVSAGATAGTGYLEGYFPWTATDGGCAREPSGFWWAGNGAAKLSDPGFMCNTTPSPILRRLSPATATSRRRPPRHARAIRPFPARCRSLSRFPMSMA